MNKYPVFNYSVGQGWTGAVAIREPTPGYGDTLLRKINMDAQGNVIALWLADNIIEVKRFNHLSGWQEKEFIGGLKSDGVDNFNFAMNSGGCCHVDRELRSLE